MKFDGTYFSNLCDIVSKTIVEAFENLTIEDINMYQLGYNKAIDDFADKLLSQPMVDKSVVRRIKEQLKAGGKE